MALWLVSCTLLSNNFNGVRREIENKQRAQKKIKIAELRVEGSKLAGDPDFALLKPEEPFVYILFLSTFRLQNYLVCISSI